MKFSFVSSVVVTSLMFAVSAFAGPTVLGLKDGSKYVVGAKDQSGNVRFVVIKGQTATLVTSSYAASFGDAAFGLAPGTYTLSDNETLSVSGPGENGVMLTRYGVKTEIVKTQQPDITIQAQRLPLTTAERNLLVATGSFPADGKAFKLVSGRPDIGTIVIQEVADFEEAFFRIRGNVAEAMDYEDGLFDPSDVEGDVVKNVLLKNSDGSYAPAISYSKSVNTISVAGPSVGKAVPVPDIQELKPTNLSAGEIALVKTAISSGRAGAADGVGVCPAAALGIEL